MYAQVLKSNMRVVLIGGESEGLPVEHPSVVCVDIGSRTDVIPGMKYNEGTGEFFENPFAPGEAPVSDPIDFSIALAELAEAEAQHDLENKLAIAELAEKLLGGAT